MIPKYVLSLVRVSTCMIIILLYIKFVAPQLSWCTQLAREVRPTLPTALLPAQSPRVSVFNLPYFVCVQGFPLKIWKVPSTIRCGTGTSLVMITHWMEVRRR